jgi:hypothetical protein
MCAMKEGSYSQRFDFGDFTKGGKRSQRTDQSPPFQRQSQSKEAQEARWERVRQNRTGMTPKEQEEQREKKQAEENRYREILFAYHSRPLTTDEWEFLESNPFHKGLFGKLSIEEELQYGNTPKFIQQDLRQRATEYVIGFARDHYPSWWEVWDENGKSISRMSPQHKASLARMRQFESLPHEEKYEILKRTFPNLFTTKHERPGEKFARVIDGFFEFPLSLFRGAEYNDQPAQQPT